jgi:hypothetical protein
MRAARTVAATAAVFWWILYLMSNGQNIWYLVAALGLTTSWVTIVIAQANRRVDQMVDPQREDPES